MPAAAASGRRTQSKTQAAAGPAALGRHPRKDPGPAAERRGTGGAVGFLHKDQEWEAGGEREVPSRDNERQQV